MAQQNNYYEMETKRAERKTIIIFSIVAIAFLVAVNYFLLF